MSENPCALNVEATQNANVFRVRVFNASGTPTSSAGFDFVAMLGSFTPRTK